MAKVALVLGGAGFIGRHVCLELALNGYAVHGLGHGRASEFEPSQWGMVRWTDAPINLQTIQEAAGPDTPEIVVHCAGSGAVGHSYAQPLDDFDRTVATTAAALDFARQRATGLRVVLASSAAVYGDQGDVDLTESAVRAPMSPYGFHKLFAESLCDSYTRFFGVRVSMVRLFSVYGEGLRKQLLWDAMNKLMRGDLSFFGTGHELRDWIHVSDAARLLRLAAENARSPFEIYNGAHSKATTREVLNTLATMAGVGSPVQFNGQVHSGNPRRLTAECAHATTQLGWEPRVGLDEGLSRYVAWYRGVLHNPT
jgi:UDP-glucose 4-epimerase